MGSIWLLSLILVGRAVPAAPAEPYEPIAEGYDVRFEVLADEERRFPAGWARIALESVTMPPSVPGIDPLEGLLLLGSDSEQGGGTRIAVARQSGGKPYSLLLIDRDRDGSFDDEDPLLTRPKRYRGRIRSLFETSVGVAHAVKGSPIWQDYPIAFSVEVNAKSETPAVLLYRQRGVSAAEIDLNGFVYDVILADADHDGVLEASDWWTMRPALSSATNPAGWQILPKPGVLPGSSSS